MTTLTDIVDATQFLMTTNDHSMPLYWSHKHGSNQYSLVQPDGCIEYTFNSDAPVEVFTDGSVSIDGQAFYCYVAQQIKFPPTKD